MHPFRRYRNVLADYGLRGWEGGSPGWIFTNAGERRVRARLDAIRAEVEYVLNQTHERDND